MLQQLLLPNLQRKQTLARRPNALDRGQGQMELFVNESELLSQCQTRALKQISIMQPSDILVINGAHGTGKTVACLNAASMALKINDDSRVVICCPTQTLLVGVMDLIKRSDKYITNVSQLLSNLTIVANEDKQSLNEIATQCLLEEKAMYLFTQQYASDPNYA